MVRYLKDGEDFGPTHFSEAGNFTKSASHGPGRPNTNRAQAQRMDVGQKSTPQDPEITSGKADGYKVQQAQPLKNGGKAIPPMGSETYGIVGGQTDLPKRLTDGMRGTNGNGMEGRVGKAMGGPLTPPGPMPAAGANPLNRGRSANPIPQANALAPTTLMANRGGARARPTPRVNPGPGVLGSPAGAPPTPVTPMAPPMKTGGRIRRDMGGAVTQGALQQARPMVQPTMAMPMPGMKNGGKLTAVKRQAMPRSDFALPGKGDGPKGAGSGSYPIPDRNHAVAALSRASANASPAEQATIRRKVHAKFPAIGRD